MVSKEEHILAMRNSDRSDLSRDSQNAVYNKSLKNAYADLLMEKLSRHGSMATDSNNDLEECEMAMIEDCDDDDVSFYRKFKQSILHNSGLDKSTAASRYDNGDPDSDDAWLDDDSMIDQDYSNEADKSFYGEQERNCEDEGSEADGYQDKDQERDWEDEGSEENEYQDEDLDGDEEGGLRDFRSDDSEYSDEEDEEWHFNTRRVTLVIFVLLGFLLAGPLLSAIVPSFSSKNTSFASPSTMPALQKQINHLYSEIDHRDQKAKSDFDKTIKVVINQFEKKIRELLPSNVATLKNQLESLTNKVNQLSISLANWEKSTGPNFSMENVTEWQLQLANELESQLPQRIPVVMNNSSTMMVIPELNEYIKNLISSLLVHSKPQPDSSFLKYDLSEYVKEILANQFQYVEKDFFIRELNRNLQMSKHEIWEEMTEKLQQLQSEQAKDPSGQSVIPQQYSNILLKKLIRQIYNTNEHQWEDDLDFCTFSQGTKLLNHLTSPTWSQGTGLGPVELLQDSKHGSSTYWQCGEPQKCSWAIRFKEPIYLTRLSYLHGRFNNNLHAMNSAPQLISVYVKLAQVTNDVDLRAVISSAQNFNQGQRLSRDKQFFRIGQYRYSLTDNKIRQLLPLPAWFIQLKPLVRSVVFEIDQNYGNKRFTSLRKFVVNAVTQEDLQIMESKTFPLRFTGAPEYATVTTINNAGLTMEPIQGFNGADPNNKKENIPSFGQDELIS